MRMVGQLRDFGEDLNKLAMEALTSVVEGAPGRHLPQLGLHFPANPISPLPPPLSHTLSVFPGMVRKKPSSIMMSLQV